jgi:hypothetical protein
MRTLLVEDENALTLREDLLDEGFAVDMDRARRW